MKKIISLILCVFLLLACSACNDTNTQNSEASVDSQVSEEQNISNGATEEKVNDASNNINTDTKNSFTEENSQGDNDSDNANSTMVSYTDNNQSSSIGDESHSTTDTHTSTNSNAFSETIDTFIPDYAGSKANEIGNSGANLFYKGGWFAAQADWYYFSTKSREICKMRNDGSNLQKIFSVDSGTIMYLNACGDWIYFYVDFNSSTSGYIARVRTDGSAFQKIMNNIAVGTMLVAYDNIYYTRGTTKYESYEMDNFPLYSIPVDGGRPILINYGYVNNIYAVGEYIYYSYLTEDEKRTICRVKYDDINKNSLISNDDIRYFAVSGNKIYFEERNKYDSGFHYSSISVTGKNYEEIAKIPATNENVCVLKNKIFYLGCIDLSYRSEYGLAMCEKIGLIQLNTTDKTFKYLWEYPEKSASYACFTTDEQLIILKENYSSVGRDIKKGYIFDENGNLINTLSFS